MIKNQQKTIHNGSKTDVDFSQLENENEKGLVVALEE